ncbi:aldehyde dehydrogenase family protein [Asanoa sp. WMMD1127]|uniref:aldehyde dehydrogenase family protein n=1 Tax=Asanoa sp. WMMD1127 TaxID=3016107 RepID=UPI002417688B|nr:aldehyde dehydrogenase family protein [Asanoa sp. WMMD1127]MDG4824792.1 aldehyde dehydrogenase family protein [Asanoa sp. WMMD1127]
MSLESSTAAAGVAARELATWSGARRRDALHAAADALSAAADRVLDAAVEETGLTRQRLEGEMARTTGQLRLLGDFVADGRDRPVVRSAGAAPGGGDIVAVRVPIGPVAVFAASNFPLAFGVLGGDTASALAAGCPVVAKAHPAQPETARLIEEAVVPALGGPAGTFAVVHGGADVSLALVRAPEIRAVGFTGSAAGGRALMDAAAARPDPIPVYAEMGALNPVFVFPSALDDERWPATLAAAVTGSAGQLCTKPGLVVVPAGEAGTAFADKLAAEVAETPVFDRMLTPSMASAHAAWRDRAPGADGEATAPDGGAAPFAVRVDGAALDGELLEEHFGPTVVIAQSTVAGYGELAARLEGSLTATVLAGDGDDDAVRALLPALVDRAGRVIYNGVPTGVAVVDAMQHGGPWPAASGAFTSVGTASVERFLRTVALQNLPERLAP